MENQSYILSSILDAFSVPSKANETLIADKLSVCSDDTNGEDSHEILCDEEKFELLHICDKLRSSSLSKVYILPRATFDQTSSESESEANYWTCKKLLGGGFMLRGFEPIHAENEETSIFKFDDNKGEDMIYLYPDLKTAIVGKFDSKELTIIKGKEANTAFLSHKNNDSESILKLSIYSKEQNYIDANENTQSLSIGQKNIIDLLLVEISNKVLTNEEPFTYFDAPNRKCISKYPLYPDALERKQVYVATTKHSEKGMLNEDLGEGLFLKKEVLQKGMLLAFFNGVRKKKTFSSFQGQEFDESSEFSGYSINVKPELSLDIPTQDQSTSRYRATLGHKACHAFKENANAEFRPIFHPRFGLIVGLFSKRPIPQNAEILIDYQYSSIQSAPTWYQQCWKKYLRETRKWPKELIEDHGYAAHDVNDIFYRTEQKFL